MMKQASMPSISPGRLPKMSSRERAKYYREKNQAYDRMLTEAVAELQEQAQQLSWKAQVLKELTRHKVPSEAIERILTNLTPFMAQTSALQFDGFRKEVVGFGDIWMHGDAQAPVVSVSLLVRGKYLKSAVKQVYQELPGRKEILQLLLYNPVEYSCISRFFFAHTGECVGEEVEVEWIPGLLKCLGNLELVELVVELLRRSPPKSMASPTASTNKDPLSPQPDMSPMEIECILSGP